MNWKDLSNCRLKNTNWFACFSLFLMFEAGANKTAVALPPTVLQSAGQYPPMLVSGNLFSLTFIRLTHMALILTFFFYILFYFYGKKKRTKKITLIIHICMLEIITLDPRKIASTGFKRQEWRWNILASWKCYKLFIPFIWKLWYHSPIKCHFYLKFQIMFSDPFKLKPILKRSIFLLFLICQQNAWKSLRIMFNKMSRY